MSLINLNQKILLKKDNCYKIVVVTEDKNVDFDRLKFNLNNLIGCTFGTSFTVEGGNLIKAGSSTYDMFEKSKVEEMLGDDDVSLVNLSRDNRNVDATKKNQLLSAGEIDEMRKNGTSGEVILNSIIENSSSFAGKTTFAQEKYLKKKKRRYLPTLSVHQITTRMLCELYAARSKLKIMNLRIDSVSQILSYANIHYGARVLMSETCAGLIMGSILERGAKVINFYHGSAPVLPENYSGWSELDDQVFNLPLAQMIPLARTGKFVNHVSSKSLEKCESKEGTKSNGDDSLKLKEEINKVRDNEQNEATSVAAVTEDELVTFGIKRKCVENNGATGKRQKLSKEVIALKKDERDSRREKATEFLVSGPVDSVVVATKYHPSLLTLTMLDFLLPGRPFVVYNQFLQPLVDLYDDLRKKGSCCLLRITESMLRNYQVLPDRTHPEMSMSGTGGYLLTGIKLASFNQ